MRRRMLLDCVRNVEAAWRGCVGAWGGVASVRVCPSGAVQLAFTLATLVVGIETRRSLYRR